MDLTSLKGEKKIKAILELANDPQNGDYLFSLISSEKGNAKQAAMQALAMLDYEPALPTWKKLIKSKNKGEKIFLQSSSDQISEIVAVEFISFFSALIKQPDGYTLTPLELTALKTFISLSLGKGSEKMQELFWLAAENADKLSSFKTHKRLFINEYIRFFNPSPDDLRKIFPAMLSMSILKTSDRRLIKLATDLNQKYGENWLSAVFISELLTKPSNLVFNNFSKYLKSKEKIYLYDTFGALYFDKKSDRHKGLLFWGQYVYGEIDTRFSFSKPLFENLDERWFGLLTEQYPEKITLQSYNRSGVLYEAYDEMLVELLPSSFQNKEIEQKLKNYFIDREKLHNGSSTLYLEALSILDCEIDEKIIERFIQCKDNAVSKYSLKSAIDNYTNWSNSRKLQFYQTLPQELILPEEIENLKQ